MARPENCRVIGSITGVSYYKPEGVLYSSLEEIVNAYALFNFKVLRIEVGDVRFRNNETVMYVIFKKEHIHGTCDEESPSCPYCSAVRTV